MRNRRTRFATAAAVVAAIVVSLTISNWLTAPAWAIGQTIKALNNVSSLVISGAGCDEGASAPFTLWIRPSQEDDEGFDMRFECADQLIVVRGKKAWVHLADKNVVMIYDDVTESDGMMRDLKWWYDLAALNPWLTGKILATVKHVAGNWEEVYGQHEPTGRDSVFVTCTYEPESKFWFVCDLETKLIVEAKYWNWSSPDREGPPACHATAFAYNEDIDDTLFDFQIPTGVRIIDKAKAKRQEQEAQTLFDRGEDLFHQEQKYLEAIEVYWQVHNTYPKLNVAEEALMMIGLCHRRLGQSEEAIEVFQQAVREYPHLKGWIDATWYYLGREYLDVGQEEEALEAFRNCLAAGEGIRDPERFPLKDAREAIAGIRRD